MRNLKRLSHPNIYGKRSTHKSQTQSETSSSSAIIAMIRKPKGLWLQVYDCNSIESVGEKMLGTQCTGVTLTFTTCSMSSSVTTIQGREDMCNVASQSSLNRRTSERI